MSMVSFRSQQVSNIKDSVITTLILLLGVGSAMVFWPRIYYAIFPVEVTKIQAETNGSPLGGDFDLGTNLDPGVEDPFPGDQSKLEGELASSSSATASAQPQYQPPVDATLPVGEWLIIPRIGVRTQPHQTSSSAEALNQGVWMVPGYGNPGSQDLPVILAAHRYGWQWWWQSDYWKYHSFYLLPELEPGDTVELIAHQRKWVYEIYAGEEGREISDYQADLILYTCKYVQSPVRHFRYARLIDPTKNTQGESSL